MASTPAHQLTENSDGVSKNVNSTSAHTLPPVQVAQNLVNRGHCVMLSLILLGGRWTGSGSLLSRHTEAGEGSDTPSRRGPGEDTRQTPELGGQRVASTLTHCTALQTRPLG